MGTTSGIAPPSSVPGHITSFRRHGVHDCIDAAGTSLQELMELGGWKSYEMVLRYAHLAPEHLSAASQRLERAWGVVDGDSTISLRQNA